MDLGHLLTFRTVVDRGSFSRAAQDLGISQPAVSNQVRSLETRLGQKLLDRGGRGAVMTPAGEVVYAAAGRMLEMQDQLERDLSDARDAISGRLCVGSSTGPGELLLPRLCARFASLYPEVKVALEVHDTQAVCERVLEGQVELGFVGAASPRRGLIFEPVITDELVLVTPPDHRLAARQTITTMELADLPMITQQEGSGVRAVLEQALGPGADVTMEMGLQQSAKAAVLDGLGITVLSRAAVQREVEMGTLASVAIIDPPLQRDFFAVSRDGRTMSRVSSVFLDFAREGLRNSE